MRLGKFCVREITMPVIDLIVYHMMLHSFPLANLAHI